MSKRVAIITDIHRNLPALEVTLAQIERLGVDEIDCGGDLVGYGPHPSEACVEIEARAIPTIYGNYDYAIGRELEDCGCAYVDPHDRAIGQLSVDWTLAHNNQQAKDFMRELPFDLRFEFAGKRVRLVTAHRAKSTSTCSRTNPRARSSALPRSPTATSSSSDIRTSRGCTSAEASSSSTAARRQAERRRRACLFRRARAQQRRRRSLDRTCSVRRSRRCREMRTVGLPDELADKLVSAT